MPDETSPVAAGATPVTPAPATGTTSASATPAKSAMTLEEAVAKIAELERISANKVEEAARHGKNLTAAEKELAVYREQDRLKQEAALSESQKAEKRASEAEARAQQLQTQLITAHVKLAAQAKGIIDPDMAAMAVHSSLEYGEDGMPNNLDKALETLIKNKPYLAPPPPPAEQPASPAQTAQSVTQRPPVTPAMNPGRSSILQPGQGVPGKPTRLEDLNWSR